MASECGSDIETPRPHHGSMWLEKTLSEFDGKVKAIRVLMEADLDNNYSKKHQILGILEDLKESYSYLAESHNQLRFKAIPKGMTASGKFDDPGMTDCSDPESGVEDPDTLKPELAENPAFNILMDPKTHPSRKVMDFHFPEFPEPEPEQKPAYYNNLMDPITHQLPEVINTHFAEPELEIEPVNDNHMDPITYQVPELFNYHFPESEFPEPKLELKPAYDNLMDPITHQVPEAIETHFPELLEFRAFGFYECEKKETKFKFEVIRLIEENLREQAELVRRNEEKRGIIRRLRSEIEGLREEFSAVKESMACKEIELKRSKSKFVSFTRSQSTRMSKLGGIVMGKIFGRSLSRSRASS